MGRDRVKIAEVESDVHFNILKLCNGNLIYFYDKYIRGDIAVYDFYSAMKLLNPCTTKVDQAIYEGYLEALDDNGFSQESISILPTLPKLLESLERDLVYVDTLDRVNEFKEKYEVYIKFYNRALASGLVKIEKAKKSRLV